MRKILITLAKFFVRLLPEGAPELIYTLFLKPKPLKAVMNAMLTAMIPETLDIGDGVVIALNKNDPVVSGALMLGAYEKFETALIRKKLGPGMTVVDIGANIGYYTAIAAKAVGPTGRVIAFEPDPENFLCLQRTVALNKFTNVECHRVGIADREGTGNLYLSLENKGDHRIYVSPDRRASIAVELATLDAFLKKRGITKIDFIKMDIQGAEGLAIGGMRWAIGNNARIQMVTEFWPLGIERTGLQPAAFLSALKELGLAICMINRRNGDLKPVHDVDVFAHQFQGREFANLYCEK